MHKLLCIKLICFVLIGERLLKNGRILLLDLYYLINAQACQLILTYVIFVKFSVFCFCARAYEPNDSLA